METWHLIEKYCEEEIHNFTLSNYEINGSIIKLKGSIRYDSGNLDDRTFEVELLDYITWIWNFKQQ